MTEPLAIVPLAGLDRQRDARRFELLDPLGRPARGVLVCWRGALYAYFDRCPHWGLALDGEDDDAPAFCDAGDALLCVWHGARFDPSDGTCLEGPCEGQRLDPLRATLSEDGHHALIARPGLLF